METEGSVGRLAFPLAAQLKTAIFLTPEVAEKAARRKFTAKYKLRILQEADACATQGQMGALLRRGGTLLLSNSLRGVVNVNKGALEALSPKTSRPKTRNSNPSVCRIAELEKENHRLKKELKQAATIIDVQKTLGNTSDTARSNRREDMMRTAKSLAQNVSIQKACKALDIPRASYYYYQKCKMTL